jgi:transcriptional regulator with XRE-family HTH domain
MAAWAGPGDDTDEEIRLCRIEYLGDDDWGFALYDPATETCEPAVLPGGQPFGSAVEEMRKRRGMTQEQVAVRMGVSVARVSQIESGDVSTQDRQIQVVTPTKVERIAVTVAATTTGPIPSAPTLAPTSAWPDMASASWPLRCSPRRRSAETSPSIFTSATGSLASMLFSGSPGDSTPDLYSALIFTDSASSACAGFSAWTVTAKGR